MMKLQSNHGMITKIVLAFLIFWGVYTPIANLIGSVASSLIFFLLDLLLTVYIISSKIKVAKIMNKIRLPELLAAILVASIYVAFRSAFSGNDARIFQNTIIIVQTIYFFEILLIMYYKFEYSKYDIMSLFLNVVFIQGILAILMLVVPTFHDVALHLYYAGGTENIYINAKRIYGLSSEYTFTTPIVNGLFATMAVFLALKKSKLYLLYLPIILLLVLLNGRTGLIVFIIGTIIILIMNSDNPFSSSIAFFFIVVGIYLTFSLVEKFSPNTYVWIQSFFSDTSNLINGNVTGNYTELQMQLPHNNLLFGYGFRIYDLNKIVTHEYIMQRSDVGYANDLFLGGIVYIILLYIPILIYIFKSVSNDKLFKGTGLSILLVIALLIADYKGETMRNGNLLLMTITFSMLFRIPKEDELIE